MRFSEIPALSTYPHVRAFVERHVDMQVDDVRTMLQLPRPDDGLTGGCNFAAVTLLCNLVSGSSELFYTPPAVPPPPFLTRLYRRLRCRRVGGGIGVARKFTSLVVAYYPWDTSERSREAEKAGILYHLARTPLTHYLGVIQKRGAPRVRIEKPAQPMTGSELETLERSTLRPAGLPLALRRDAGAWVVDVPGLYWAVFHLFRALTEDAEQMRRAEQKFRPC